MRICALVALLATGCLPEQGSLELSLSLPTEASLRPTGMTTVTVTATGTEESVSRSIQSVSVLSSVELAQKNPVSLGEALDQRLTEYREKTAPLVDFYKERGLLSHILGEGHPKPVFQQIQEALAMRA